MKATLSITGDFVREIEIRRLEALADTYHLEFRSRLATAKSPLELKRNFDLLLSRDELLQFKDLVAQALGE
jgi:hypothetical protein